MIKIGEIRKEIKGGRVRIVSDISMGDKVIPLFFETEEENSKYLCEESGDAFLLGVLLYAMKKHEDIHVEPPVSERLLYGITQILMPVFPRMSPELRNINIISAKTCCKSNNKFGGVVTPMSCGVDSFYTALLNNKKDIFSSMKLTHLALFNSGVYGYDVESSKKEFELYKNRIRPVCQQFGLPLVSLDSNLMEFASFPFIQIHTFNNTACALILQKLIKTFYYSTTYQIRYFALRFDDSAFYDLLNESALRTEGFEMISFGGDLSRLEKTEIIAKYVIVENNLNVCVKTEKEKLNKDKINCSICAKCIRTMAALDILGILSRYNKVFEVNKFNENRALCWGKIRYKSFRTKRALTTELIKMAKKYKYRIPFSSYFWKFGIGVNNQLKKFKRNNK